MNTPTVSLPRPPLRHGVLAALVVLVSAFLLFVLELATARALLPRFGGSPTVWTTSMLVYQALLLAGYAYAHALAGRRSGTRQAVTHAVLLVLAVTMAYFQLHVGTFAGGDPAAVSRHPLADLLRIMLVTMALPFVAISATAPLVQHWQQRIDASRSAYWLYGVSSAGSFAGLLAYPFIIEPLLDLERQFFLWTLLFGLTAIGLVILGVAARRGDTTAAAAPAAAPPAPTLLPAGPPHRRRELALWLALPAGTSALLLAATNELCQDLAVFPFLWVVPLSLYLLSFSLTFRARPPGNLVAPAAVATLVALGTTSASLILPAPVHIIAIGALVFVLCLAVHRELYRIRPPAERLTAYYLWIATGSLIGATAVALIAPALFRGYWEFQLAILAAWLALIAATALDREGCLRKGDRRQTATLLGILVFQILNQIPEAWILEHVPGWPGIWSVPLRIGAALVLAALAWRFLRRSPSIGRPLWPRILVGLIIFFIECSILQRIRSDRTGSYMIARNFFGVVRIQEVMHGATSIRVRQLTHGRINHGWQYMNAELRGLPTAYHSPSTGIGRLIQALQERQPSVRIGVTGLGAGALAAYPRATDQIVFYEIDPQVVKLAAGPGAVFSFLNDCPGKTEIALGDARQSMQSELVRNGSRKFDVLALDAFSSDAIPTHLLTREAFTLYLQHLSGSNAVLAVNISNRFLNIEPVLSDMAAALNLQAVLIDSLGDPPVRARSLWVLLAQGQGVLETAGLAALGRPLTERRQVWTDTYASPMALMKWWSPDSRRLHLMPRRQSPEETTDSALAPR